ncbi:unnamed protein product [Gongylonema pulchrum]|uniref:60S ribosomal protein L23 n=1 Tax=Gongylonema pulchrum TaxID=637853 RepID=A0A183EHZ5_9BILA|nr:unnamed protein product [Gongylonema pulchrum]
MLSRHELSRHRTRPPNPGIHRRTRLLVVDNSALGKEANTCGKLAYCIDVCKPGRRKKHMPHATLGDKRAFVVGANTHVHYRKHGIPSTDTNNIVLLVSLFIQSSPVAPLSLPCPLFFIVQRVYSWFIGDDEGNPLGTRILMPVPAVLQRKRDNLQLAKVLSLATKYF